MKNKRKVIVVFGIVILTALISTIAGLCLEVRKASEIAAYVELGNRYLSELDYEQAIVSYKQALELDENNYDASMGLAEAYDSNQMYAYAEAAYQNMLEADDTQADVYEKLVDLFVRQDKQEEAEKLLVRAAENTDNETIIQLLDETHPDPPVMNYSSGTYKERIKIELLPSDENHTIYYSLDGSEPGEDSEIYSNPIILPNGVTTVKAAAFNSLGFQSDVIESVYNIAIPDRVVEVREPIIEQIIHEAMDIPYDQDIYNDDIEQITELYIIGLELAGSYDSHSAFFEETSYIIDGYTYNSREYGVITSLQDLKNMPFLEKVVISFQPELDVAGIASLTEIRELSLVGDGLTNADVSIISNLSKLEVLNLGWNEITDIEPLGKLDSLSSLGIWGNKIESIEAVKTLEGLIYLDFSDNLVTDIESVKNLSNLQQLWMYHNQINDISCVSELNNLNVLMLKDNPITNPEEVKNIYPHLTRLDVDLLRLEGKNHEKENN